MSEDLTIKVTAQIAEAKRQLEVVQNLANKTANRNYKVQFRVDYAELRRQMAQIQQTKVNPIQVDIEATKREIRELIRTMKNLREMGFDVDESPLPQYLEEATRKLEALRDLEKDVTLEQREMNARMAETSAEMRETSAAAEAYRTKLNRIKSEIVQFGSRLQTLGRTLTSISGIFTRFFSGAIMGAGYQALSKLMAGFQGAFERSDTFATYEHVLSAMGHDASKKFAIGTNEAATALENLETAVLGLPTGLDEITEAQKGYLAVSGDMEKATKVAIAANNTFLASGTDSRNKNRARKQLNNLLAGTEMTKARWQAIVESMPLAVDAVGKELGYKGEEALKEFRASLLEGNIGTEDFLRAFMTVGTTGTIHDATEVMKHTYSAAFANWENATKRMGANVIDALSDTLKKSTGKDLIDYLNDVKLAIDDISRGVQDWIKANPDKITGFFERLKKIDIVSVIKGMGEALLEVVEILGKFIPEIGGENLGKAIVKLSALGPVVTALGGFIKGTAGASSWVAVNATGWSGDTGLFGFLKNLAKSRGSVKGAAEAAEGVANAGKAVSKIPISWESVASKAVSIAAIPAIAGSVWLGAKALQEIEKVNLDWKHLLNTIAQMGTAIAAIGGLALGLGYLLGSTPVGWITAGGAAIGVGAILAMVGTITSIAEAFDRLSKAEIPDKSRIDTFANTFKQIIPAIKDIIDELAGNKGMIVGWTKKSEAKSAESIVRSFKGILDSFVEMTDVLTEISKVKKIESKLQKAADVITQLGKGLEPLKTAIAEAFGSYERDFVEQGNVTVRKTFDETAVSEYEKMTESLGRVFTNIGTMIDNFLEMRKNVNKIMAGKSKVNFGKFRENLSSWIKEVSLMIMGEEGNEDNLYTLGQKAKWVNEGGITNISNAFFSLGTLVDRLRDFSVKVNGYGEDSPIMTHAKEGISAISGLAMQMVNVDTFPNANYLVGKLENLGKSLDEMTKIPGKIRTLAMMLDGGLDLQLEKIQKFFSSDRFKGWDDIIVSTHVLFDVDLGDAWVTVYNAVWNEWVRIEGLLDTMNLVKTRVVDVRLVPMVSGTDKVIAAINSAHLAINEALRWTQIPKNRTVTINLNPKVNRGSIPQEFHMGGEVLYRAGGGDIFRPRGTDTVPAMLTPGEWVMNTRAVKRFGTDFMDRVNNLDIKGAIRALHARVGSTMASSQRTIVNNNHTDNRSYSNVQNINTNNPNFAFRRSRWVSELR